ncbi:MAG: respiratory nitrate reductase subunit beta, partial [Chloroflexota bacterium]|nr:respiratory nitrate reductase subunit beta [Chloroflexota bacterium]
MAEVQRQAAMVMDLNKCLGCQTCTIACKTLWTDKEGMEYMWWNLVTTMPGHGSPRDWQNMGGGFADGIAQPGRLPTREEFGEAWEFNYEDVFEGGKGTSEHLRPQGGATYGFNWEEDQGDGEYPNAYYFYLQTICNHCTRPACLAACPRQAIYKRPQDGIVLIDEKRCNGYRFCVEACPYKKIYFNHVKKIAQKCIFCFPRFEQKVANACARQCPGRVRWVGFLDDEDGPVFKLVKGWKVAIPLHPEYGTGPNVYYVPPLSPPRFDENGEIDEDNPRIPIEYLRYLFGPEVDAA